MSGIGRETALPSTFGHRSLRALDTFGSMSLFQLFQSLFSLVWHFRFPVSLSATPFSIINMD